MNEQEKNLLRQYKQSGKTFTEALAALSDIKTGQASFDDYLSTPKNDSVKIAEAVDNGYSFSELGGDIKETFSSIGDTVRETGQDFRSGIDTIQDNSSGLSKYFSAGLRGAGSLLKGVGGVATDLVTGAGKMLLPQSAEDTIKSGVEKVGEGIKYGLDQTDLDENAIAYWKGFEQSNPVLAENLKSLGGGVAGALELAGYKGGGVLLKETGNIAKEVGKRGVEAGLDLSDTAFDKAVQASEILKKAKMPNPSGLVDSAVIGAAKVSKAVQKVPEAAGNLAKKAIDKQNIKYALSSPAKAKKKIVDLYREGIRPGVGGIKKTIGKTKEIDDSVYRTALKLSNKVDTESDDVLTSFANAIANEKKNVWSKIEQLSQDASGNGIKISLKPIVEELDNILATERVKVNSNLRKAVERYKNEFINEAGDVIEISPTGAQSVIADYNNALSAFYKGSSLKPNRDLILAGINEKLRKLVDDAVESLDGKSYQALRNEYKDLKNIEKPVTHRAIYEAQKGPGLGKYADIMASGDILGGVASGSPLFIAKGAGTYITKEVLKSLNDKNELIRQMFTVAKKLSEKSN